jgi:hypothetical protein
VHFFRFRGVGLNQTLLALVACILASSAKAGRSQPPTPAARQLEVWLERFPEADADGDGRLTAGEAAAYREVRGKKQEGATQFLSCLLQCRA